MHSRPEPQPDQSNEWDHKNEVSCILSRECTTLGFQGRRTMNFELSRALGCGGILAGLVGCQIFGPAAIEAGRQPYNEVIQETSKVQTFSNIIRVKNHEPTTFIDVSQVSAQMSAQATFMGAVSAIGGARVGSANMGLTLSETPTITYTPLTGQALVQQIATPLTIDSL